LSSLLKCIEGHTARGVIDETYGCLSHSPRRTAIRNVILTIFIFLFDFIVPNPYIEIVSKSLNQEIGVKM